LPLIFFGIVLISFLSLWQNTWDEQLLKGGKVYFGFWFQNSVHGWLSSLSLGLWQARTSWQAHVAEETAHLMALGRQKARHRIDPGSHYPLQGHALRDLASFHQATPANASTSHWLGTKPLVHGLGGNS
jgi:hypothetical protein